MDRQVISYIMPMKLALTIAGYDPSAGAGVLADIKSFEHCQVLGQAVCTAITLQNESFFAKPGWLLWKQIKAQLQIISRVRSFSHVKIGLVKDPKTLELILKWLKRNCPGAYILWDPVLKASAGYEIHNQEPSTWLKLLSYIDLVTPNYPEAAFLGLLGGSPQAAVLVKGGHSPSAKPSQAQDLLYLPGAARPVKFSARRIKGAERHGSGCAYSSLILANLLKTNDLESSIREAKASMQTYFKNGSGKLGCFYRP